MLKLCRFCYYFFNGRAALKKQCGHLICMKIIVYNLVVKWIPRRLTQLQVLHSLVLVLSSSQKFSTNFSLTHVEVHCAGSRLVSSPPLSHRNHLLLAANCCVNLAGISTIATVSQPIRWQSHSHAEVAAKTHVKTGELFTRTRCLCKFN